MPANGLRVNYYDFVALHSSEVPQNHVLKLVKLQGLVVKCCKMRKI